MKILLSIAACSLMALAVVAVPTQAARFEEPKPAPTLACDEPFDTVEAAAKAVVSDNADERDSARRFLRIQGVKGLQALRETWSHEIKHHLNSPASPEVIDATRWQRIDEALDFVAQQKDAWSQGAPLFWLTDVEAAKIEAKRTGKPILSLRLLGKLTDEFSCANSRFFRAALYANADVSRYLSDHFVLLWTTERPVPKVTIDMGDGRIMTCTITGNSAHYVLDGDGRPLDCIPGLYSPAAFKECIERCVKLHTLIAGKGAAERARLLSLHHKARLSEVTAAFLRDAYTVGIDPAKVERQEVPAADEAFLRGTGAIAAKKASKRAAAKSEIERPYFLLMGKEERAAFEGRVNEAAWAKMAALRPAALDEGSVRLIKSQNPESAEEASKRAMSKKFIEDPIFRLVRKFEQNIALDTVKNEYLFHMKIHEWFANGEVETFEKFNERVYAELFFTPANDPWLGLKGDDYTGLKNDGISK